MAWTPIYYLKEHKGKTLPEIFIKDPDLFFYLYEINFLKGINKTEADKIYQRARSIRIPDSEGRDMVVEYSFDPRTGKFLDFEIVPRSQPRHTGSTNTLRKGVIDLYQSRKKKEYDKLGSKHMIKGLKSILGRHYKIEKFTKKFWEDFFDNEENFTSGS